MCEFAECVLVCRGSGLYCKKAEDISVSTYLFVELETKHRLPTTRPSLSESSPGT